MTSLARKVLTALTGRTIATAESCTGGDIAAALTAVPGSSSVVKGGIVSYCNEIKNALLGVDWSVLNEFGAVSEPVAAAMVQGAREKLQTDVAVSVTGLAGPDGDEYGNPVGTVFIGYCDESVTEVQKFQFLGNREEVRIQSVNAAFELILQHNK